MAKFNSHVLIPPILTGKEQEVGENPEIQL